MNLFMKYPVKKLVREINRIGMMGNEVVKLMVHLYLFKMFVFVQDRWMVNRNVRNNNSSLNAVVDIFRVLFVHLWLLGFVLFLP